MYKVYVQAGMTTYEIVALSPPHRDLFAIGTVNT